MAEVEELENQAVERFALRDGASEERDGAPRQVFGDVLQIVAKLQKDPPLEGEADIFRGEPWLREAGIGEDRDSTFRASYTQECRVIE